MCNWKKKIACLLMLVCMLSTAVCSAEVRHDGNGTGTDIIFSNLVDQDSQQLIAELLAEAGVSGRRIEVLLDHINQFIQSVDTSKLAAGIVTGDPTVREYDLYELQDQWVRVHPEFEGYNCRVTAFELFGDYVHVDQDGDIRDRDLFLDSMSLDQDPSALVDADKEAFLRLFSVVPTTNTTDTGAHMDHVIRDWEQRGIHFADNERISLITVWFHNQWSPDENELFIGHAGTLVGDHERLCFIEKLAFQEPYQATWFNNRSELYDYLMRKYDVSWGQDTAKPFVMENDHVLNYGTADIPAIRHDDISETEETYMTNITMAEAKEIFTTPGDYIILDVRRADEFAAGHIPGAINVANESIISTPPAELPDKDQLIYVYCRSGNRSKQATAKLVAMGYTHIVEFGGFLDWTGDVEK